MNLSLIDLLKDKTVTIAYVDENKYKGGKHMYTDGSKNETGVGAAATTGKRTKSASLRKFSSIFTAETHAIHRALNTISATKGDNFTVSTDSKS